MRISLGIFILFLHCLILQTNAQYIPFDNYTVQEENPRKRLPQGFISDIEQDSLGYLWLGTQAGAYRYDGYNFVPYTIEEGLLDNNITDIYIDNRQQIWIASESGGLAILKDNKLDLINTSHGLVSNYSQKVIQDSLGNIWYFSLEGVSIIKSDTILNLNADNSGISGKILSTWLGFNNIVWFSTYDSLYFYNNNRLQTFKHPLLGNYDVHSILEDKPNSLWLGTEGNGTIHISNGKSEVYNKNNYLPSNTCLALLSTKPDHVIITTSNPGSIHILNNGKPKHNWTSRFNDLIIKDLYQDRRGRIWLNTQSDGVILIEDGRLKRYNIRNNLVNNYVQKIHEDQDGNIWFGTDNGLSKYGKIVFNIYNQNLIEDNTSILSIAEQNQTIYLGTNSGLNILREDSIIEKYSRFEDLGSNPEIYSILPLDKKILLGTYDKITIKEGPSFSIISYASIFSSKDQEWTTDIVGYNNIIYAATSNGLIKYDGKRIFQYTTNDGLADNNIWSLAVDSIGNIWCATINGLSILVDDTIYSFNVTDGLPHHYCNDIVFDKEGYAWLATDDGIVKIFLNDDLSINCEIPKVNAMLKTNLIWTILIDDNGYIWAGHNQGLDRIDLKTNKVVHYGSLEGFLPIETNAGAATKTSSNELWFGTTGGAVKYLPDNDIEAQNSPKVYIQKVNLYEDSTNILKYQIGKQSSKISFPEVILPYNKNNLLFHYVGIHYTIVEKNQYKYMLEGFDEKWSEPTHNITSIPYRRIPPGRYTFKVLAANCDGIWTDEPATYQFQIKPPFYSTWWFYTVEGIAAIALLLFIIRLRERKLRHDKEVLTQKVKERTVEIEKQRDQIVLQKKEITDSIEYAEKIQEAVLPKRGLISKLLPQYFILFKPRDIVSGDFYWLNEKHGKIFVIAADCTGHGVPGAFMSMLGVSILNELHSKPELHSADKLLNELRDHLIETLRQSGTSEEAKDGMDLSLIILDPNNLCLEFAGAYNPLVIIRNNECLVFKGDKMPVGYHMGKMPGFTKTDIQLQQGDCLYLFSDGYADQFGGPNNKKFKSSAFRELLSQIAEKPINEQKIILNETIERWKGINEQVDDILVIGIRV